MYLKVGIIRENFFAYVKTSQSLLGERTAENYGMGLGV